VQTYYVIFREKQVVFDVNAPLVVKPKKMGTSIKLGPTVCWNCVGNFKFAVPDEKLQFSAPPTFLIQHDAVDEK